MNGSLGTLLPSSVPSSLSSAVTSPEDDRRCALFSVGDEHAAVSRAASPAPIKVLLSTLGWLAEAWSVIIEGVSLSVLCDPMPGRWEGAWVPPRCQRRKNRPRGYPHSVGFAICSPQGIGDPHDIAPRGS